VEPLPARCRVRSAARTFDGARYGPEPRLRLPQDCSVLLVDDNSVNQLVMRGMLLKLGFRSARLTAAGGTRIVAGVKLRRGAARLPVAGRGGVSLCCQIRALPGCAELPVFMIARRADRALPARRVDRYLNKPVKFEDLQTALYRRVLCA
jgi:CheY-like chemotaxis protein